MVSGRIYVTNDKIVCGSREGTANVLYPHSGSTYVHPSEKQCNYTPDLSTYATKEELEEVKGLIDMGAKIVGSGSLIADRASSVTVPACDYVEIISEMYVCSAGIVPKASSIVYKGTSANVDTVTDVNSSTGISRTEFSLNSTGRMLSFKEGPENGEQHFNWIAYKYN